MITDLLQGPTVRPSGWVVRVVGKGTDKSDFQITRVCDLPGSLAEELTRHDGLKFKRNGATVWKYRAEARKDKKSRKWVSNRNSWSKQYDYWST